MKNKLKSLFKNEWIWRLFVVLQVGGIIGIIYLTLTNDDRWNLIPHQTVYTDDPAWDFLNSRFWTEYHENWFAAVFLFGPILISKATDWIFAAKKKDSPSGDWKQN
jgi:hypothetical protein